MLIVFLQAFYNKIQPDAFHFLHCNWDFPLIDMLWCLDIHQSSSFHPLCFDTWTSELQKITFFRLSPGEFLHRFQLHLFPSPVEPVLHLLPPPHICRPGHFPCSIHQFFIPAALTFCLLITSPLSFPPRWSRPPSFLLSFTLPQQCPPPPIYPPHSLLPASPWPLLHLLPPPHLLCVLTSPTPLV